MSALSPSFRRIATFSAIGVVNTALYAAISYVAIKYLAWPAAMSAAIGYLCGACFSYVANAFVTFEGVAAHCHAAPRFVLSNLLGLAASASIPALAIDGLGLAAGPSIVAASLIVPPLNYLLMSRFVFVHVPGKLKLP